MSATGPLTHKWPTTFCTAVDGRDAPAAELPRADHLCSRERSPCDGTPTSAQASFKSNVSNPSVNRRYIRRGRALRELAATFPDHVRGAAYLSPRVSLDFDPIKSDMRIGGGRAPRTLPRRQTGIGTRCGHRGGPGPCRLSGYLRGRDRRRSRKRSPRTGPSVDPVA